MKPPKSDPLRALSDPLRISLFELIKDGEKTTPELADILNENRMSLYHHLKILEQAGLITSRYNSNREKVFSVESEQVAEEVMVQHQEQVTIIPNYANSSPVETIILSPPTDPELYKEFRELIDNVAKVCGKSLDANQEILQVQVTTEEEQLYIQKRSRSMSYSMNKRNKK